MVFISYSTINTIESQHKPNDGVCQETRVLYTADTLLQTHNRGEL